MTTLRGDARGGTPRCEILLSRVMAVLQVVWPEGLILASDLTVPLNPCRGPRGRLYIFETQEALQPLRVPEEFDFERVARVTWDPGWNGPYVRTGSEELIGGLDFLVPLAEGEDSDGL